MRSLYFFYRAWAVLFFASSAVYAWDYPGHRMVNQAALADLPEDFPAFVREPENAERIAFLAGEADRWKNISDPVMKHSGGSWLDHFIDLEQLPEAGIDLATLTSFRYDFAVAFASGRGAHPQHFPSIDPARNIDHTREWPGFLPWAINEYYAKVKSAFTYLKAFEENGTPEEIANAKANAVYVMGMLGHLVGDAAQPLHTTKNHNGWVGENPKGYTESKGFHSFIDSGFIGQAGISLADVTRTAAPASLIRIEPRSDQRDPVFVAIMDYILEQHALVAPLYEMEKAGKFNLETGNGAEGRAFIEGQLRKGGHMLSSLWLTAWRNAGPDVFLRTQLLKRKAGVTGN